MTEAQRQIARERLANVDRAQREFEHEQSMLLAGAGFVVVDDGSGRRWRDPVQGDTVTLAMGVHRIRAEVRS